MDSNLYYLDKLDMNQFNSFLRQYRVKIYLSCPELQSLVTALEYNNIVERILRPTKCIDSHIQYTEDDERYSTVTVRLLQIYIKNDDKSRDRFPSMVMEWRLGVKLMTKPVE